MTRLAHPVYVCGLCRVRIVTQDVHDLDAVPGEPVPTRIFHTCRDTDGSGYEHHASFDDWWIPREQAS